MSDLLGPAPGDAVFDEMVDRRRAVHRRPELAFAEHHTTAIIRDHMGGLGIDEAPRVTETGGIFALEGGRPGRSVVLRADIDALPVQEDEARAGRSEVEGVMHACGHDVHVAALLGAATRAGARDARTLPGRYVFVFQPGEEALCGAKAMVEGGALDHHGGRPAWSGFHVTSQLPTGLVALREGVTMSEAHSLRVTLLGPGRPRCHADRPGRRHPGDGRAGATAWPRWSRADATRAPTACAARARCTRARAVNVVPTTARVTGTLRTFTAAQREEALGRLRALCDEVGDALGCRSTWSCPSARRAVVNDAGP